jgi:hypothetical protein
MPGPGEVGGVGSSDSTQQYTALDGVKAEQALLGNPIHDTQQAFAADGGKAPGGTPMPSIDEMDTPTANNPAAAGDLVNRLASDSSMVMVMILIQQVHWLLSKMNIIDREKMRELSNTLVAEMAKDTAETIMRKAELEKEKLIDQAIVQSVALGISAIAAGMAIGGPIMKWKATDAGDIRGGRAADMISTIGDILTKNAPMIEKLGTTIVEIEYVEDIARQDARKLILEAFMEIIKRVGQQEGDLVSKRMEIDDQLLRLGERIAQILAQHFVIGGR